MWLKYISSICGVIVLGLIGLATSEAVAEPLRIGIVAPLSGEYSKLGSSFVKAAELAVKDLDAKGIKIQLIVEDDEFKPTRGLAAVKKLVRFDRVHALINLSTPTMNSSYHWLRNENLPIIQLGLFEGSAVLDNVLLIQGDFDQPLQHFADFVEEKTGSAIVDLFYSEDATILHYVELFTSAYAGEVRKVPVTNISDLAMLVLKTSNKKPTAVVTALTPDLIAELMRRFLILQQKPAIFSIFDLSVGSQTVIERVNDREYLDSTYYLDTRQATDPNFARRFRLEVGEELQPWADLGHDAVVLLQRTYNPNKELWLSNLQAYQGILPATGKLEFTAGGVRKGGFKIHQFKDLNLNPK